MSDDGYNVEDVLKNLQKKQEKKRTNSKDKGVRGENGLKNVLLKRFPDRPFFRVVGSGNRWAQVDLTEENRAIFTGDIVCPAGFRFVIECKYGYDDIDLSGAFAAGNRQIDEFLRQVQKSADSVGKEPLLCWRKPHRPWLAFLQGSLPGRYDYLMQYQEWNVVGLDAVLALPDDFWFRG